MIQFSDRIAKCYISVTGNKLQQNVMELNKTSVPNYNYITLNKTLNKT